MTIIQHLVGGSFKGRRQQEEDKDEEDMQQK